MRYLYPARLPQCPTQDLLFSGQPPAVTGMCISSRGGVGRSQTLIRKGPHRNLPDELRLPPAEEYSYPTCMPQKISGNRLSISALCSCKELRAIYLENHFSRISSGVMGGIPKPPHSFIRSSPILPSHSSRLSLVMVASSYKSVLPNSPPNADGANS